MIYLIDFLKKDLITVLQLIAGVALVGYKLPRRKHFPARFAIGFGLYFLWSICFLMLGSRFPDSILLRSIVKYCCVFALTVGVTMLCLKTNLLPAVFCVTVSYCLEHMSQRISSLLLNYLVPLSCVTGKILFQAAFTGLLYVLLYRLLIRHFLCKEGETYRDNRMLLVLAVVVIAGDIILCTIGMHLVFQADNTSPMIIIHLFSILCSVLVLVISMCSTKLKSAQKEVLIVEQLLHSERAQFKRDNAVVDMLNIKCHDLKHQISMVEEKLDRQEAAEIRRVIQAYDQSIKTGSAALDVVLYNKSLLCDHNHITLTCVADGAALSFLSDADIYSLFGNILDNAIDSAGRVSSSDGKIIMLTVRKMHNYLFIHQENYYTNELHFQDGLPETSKRDKIHHGFGMLSIRTLVQKYGGDLQINANGGIFKLDIMFPVDNP